MLGALAAFVIMLMIQATEPDSYFEISKNMEVFTSLFKELNTYYVDPIQPGKMMKTGIDAMLHNLDPYTTYITEEDIEDYRIQTTGKYGGIGSSLRQQGDYLMIGEPFENSPVVKAGLKAGDIIMELDGRSVKGKDVDEVSKFIKGSPGTTLKLKIKNPITGTVSDKSIVREEISISAVPYADLIGPNKEFAYVRLTQFTERCTNYVRSALDSLKKVKPDMKGVILDLRYNPGGLLDEAVSTCNLFINGNQLVVSTKGKAEEWDKSYLTKNAPWDEKIPLAVLVNKNSASASEIVAGTMQDVDRGVIIGQKSFGKGLVQTTRNLPFNAKLKVTTAKYYTPSGRCIQVLDYTHRNEDGSVGEVPDSIKTKFKTKNGRTVMDGGGIEPDIKIAAKDALKIVATLMNKQYVFDYATQYAGKHASIADPGSFKLSEADYDDFVNWLESKDISYKTSTEEALAKFKDMAEKESYFDGIKKDYEVLEKSVAKDKKQDLIKHRDEVKQVLQEEIVSRYYFLRGRLKNQLATDEEVKQAVQVLGNPTQYTKLLSK